MNNAEKVKASRFLSFVLRHEPGKINIILDRNGWVSVGELLEKMKSTRYKLTFEQLKDIVETDDKKRYAFTENFSKIRASQGHSVKIDLGLKPVMPPNILYHGTAGRFLNSIMKQGLGKMKRQHVHLSGDFDTAIKVGARHGNAVVLTVDAAKMVNDGYLFYISENEVWLTDNVPAEYIQI